MRSFTIALILFMLSFSIVHDTFIHTMHENVQTVHTAYAIDNHTQSQECDALDEIHAMFHLEALIAPYIDDHVKLPAEASDSYYVLKNTQTFKETTYKPPQA